jgi:hypothetical protein
MNLAALRDFWRARWGAPPKLRSTELMRLIIAWRVQAAVEGGLDAETRVKLRSTSIPRMPNPPPGTRLTREYRGVMYTVEIAEAGVRHAGRTYRSLSEVASKITGISSARSPFRSTSSNGDCWPGIARIRTVSDWRPSLASG